MIIMGRRVPSDNLSLIHPILYLSFLAAGLAASIAIITAICSVRVRFRKKSSPPPSDPLEKGKDLDASTPPSIMVATGKPEESEQENNEVQIKELPLPPAMQQPKDLFPSNNLKRATSERKTPFSLSLKMPRSLSVSKNWDHIREEKLKGKLMKTEESVWMKTIILGDKCVPDEEDPAVIYEGKGKRISAYHPRTHSSMSLSRQFSFLEPDDLSIPKPKTPEERFNNT